TKWLSIAEFSYNDKVNNSTGQSPFYLNLRYHPYCGTNYKREVRNESAKEFVDHMQCTREEAATAIKCAQENMKQFYDHKR
ncbi:hypothetical protein L218DRAFT_799981, partial [Marasmius fiardii PR-910]